MIELNIALKKECLVRKIQSKKKLRLFAMEAIKLIAPN